MRWRHVGRLVLLLGGPGLCAAILAVGLSVPEAQLARRDWWQYYVVGQHLRTGDIGSVYDARALGVIYAPPLHPPPYLWGPFLLAHLPVRAAYGAVALTQLGAAVLALRLTLGRCDRIALSALLGSMPLTLTLLLGQAAGLWALAVAGGAWCLTKRDPFMAGLCLGGLALKPNLLVPLAPLFLLRRETRPVVLGLLVAGLLLLLLSWPFGLDAWAAWHLGAGRVDETAGQGHLLWKQVTLYGLLRGALRDHHRIATSLWLLVTTALLTLLVRAWRAPRSDADRLGLAILFVVLVNPHCLYYDALLLGIPAALWRHDRDPLPAILLVAFGGYAAALTDTTTLLALPLLGWFLHACRSHVGATRYVMPSTGGAEFVTVADVGNRSGNRPYP